MNLSKKLSLITVFCLMILTLCSCGSVKKNNKPNSNTAISIIKENYFSDLSLTEYKSISSTGTELFSDENNNTLKISEYIYDDITNMAYVEISMCGNNIGKPYLDATDNNSDTFICDAILQFNNIAIGIMTTDDDTFSIAPERYQFDKNEIKFVYKLSDFSGEIILWKYDNIPSFTYYDEIPAPADRTSYDYDGEILDRAKLESTIDDNSSYSVKNDTYEVSVSKMALSIISNETAQNNDVNTNVSSDVITDSETAGDNINIEYSTNEDLKIELEYSDGSREEVTYSHMYGSIYDNGKSIKTYIFKKFINPKDILAIYINDNKIENQ